MGNDEGKGSTPAFVSQMSKDLKRKKEIVKTLAVNELKRRERMTVSDMFGVQALKKEEDSKAVNSS